MFNIGGLEWIIILAFILLLFGGSKIPELARSLGRAKGEFQRGQRELEREMDEDEKKPSGDEKIKQAARSLGIKTKGKSRAQLKKEIAKKMTE